MQDHLWSSGDLFFHFVIYVDYFLFLMPILFFFFSLSLCFHMGDVFCTLPDQISPSEPTPCQFLIPTFQNISEEYFTWENMNKYINIYFCWSCPILRVFQNKAEKCLKDNKFPVWNQTDDGILLKMEKKKKTSLIPLGWKKFKSLKCLNI